MLDKKQIINFLFIISLPVYGVGQFVSATVNSPTGHAISMSVPILILLFYLIDLLYKKQFQVRVNRIFFLMILFHISCITAFFISLSKNAPFINQINTYSRSLLVVFPFYAFIAVCLYNQKDYGKLVKLTFTSLTVLLLINLFGYFVLGLRNATHTIEGRVSLPFLDGMYSAACVIAIISLMLLYYMKKALMETDTVKFMYLLGYFCANLILLFFINSRLTNLIFLFVAGLGVINMLQNFRGLFVIGVFFVPLLLNLSYLLYQILTWPFFKAIMQRVDVRDVTTFNGRAFAWQRAIHWLVDDQTNVIFGNGYNGHYFLHLMTNIAKLWGVRETSTHLHSAALSVLVDQGIIGAILLLAIAYQTFVYFKVKLRLKKEHGILFPVMVFILFVMQVDMFVYYDSMGAVIFAFLVAIASMRWKNKSKDSKHIHTNGE